MQVDDKKKDYILLMLGAPVVNIPLDDQQIQIAIDSATRYVTQSATNGGKTISDETKERLIDEGAVAYANNILARTNGEPVGDSVSNWKDEVWYLTHHDPEVFQNILYSVIQNPSLASMCPVTKAREIANKLYEKP